MQKADVGRDVQFARSVPACLVESEHGVCASRDAPTDLVQVMLQPHFALQVVANESGKHVVGAIAGVRNFTGLVGYLSCANAVLEPGAGTIHRNETRQTGQTIRP